LTTTTVPTDTSGESSEDDSAWAFFALGVALGKLRDPETPTTTSEAPATTTPTTRDTSPAETVAAEPTSSEGDTPWGWIALGLGLVLAAAIAGVVLWRRKRRGPPESEVP
jgi:LPXTG-motif cell wall-anchored protein